ncbi:thioesterase domain-containing protein [Streptomyces sp. NPDC093252]|uniref:thioesterase domain-containing protein n=1 Tax=Streptomyces sp. NPDC093252 TaxID=3154980 RepID=UPI00343E4F31
MTDTTAPTTAPAATAGSLEDRVRALSDTKRLALRRLIADRDAEARLLALDGSALKLLRGGPGPNLFVFPATEGSVGYMTGYLPHIPDDWSVYGCQTPGLEGEREPYTTVEDIAAHNVRQIRRVQPHGPYYLAGNCMGGLPAFETARQLHLEGAGIGLVLHLMPTFRRQWNDLPALDSLDTRALIDYGFIIERLVGEPVRLPLDEIAGLPEAERTDRVVDFLARHPSLKGVDTAVVRHRIGVYRANLGAMFAYRPGGGFDGGLTVVAVGQDEQDEGVVDPDSPYASAINAMAEDRVRVLRVDADASALFDCAEPHITRVGKVLRTVLTEAGADRTSRAGTGAGTPAGAEA